MDRPQSSPRRTTRRKTTSPKPPKGNYAFIDSQNLNLGVQKIGWKMDWRRFRQWLADKYNVTHAYMFIGYMAENEALYEQMHDLGYLIVLKPTTEIKVQATQDKNGATEGSTGEEQKPVVKGNIDADLVLYAMKEYPNYDKAIIVSGDGDFFGLIEHLAQHKKLLHLMTPNWRYSSLLKEFEPYIVGLEQHRKELAYHDRHPRGGKSKPPKPQAG